MNLKKTALENTVGKGENNGSQHFLLFPGVFYSIKERNCHLTNSHTMTPFDAPGKQAF